MEANLAHGLGHGLIDAAVAESGSFPLIVTRIADAR
jgi:hypothetical protein